MHTITGEEDLVREAIVHPRHQAGDVLGCTHGLGSDLFRIVAPEILVSESHRGDDDDDAIARETYLGPAFMMGHV